MKLTRNQLARKTAYQIDPLLAASVEIDDRPPEPCRVNGEIHADAFWKDANPRLLRNVPLEGLKRLRRHGGKP